MSDYIGRPCGSVCGIPEDAHQTEEHPWVAAREPAGAGLRTAAKTLSLALSEFLISLWTGNTTTRRRDLDAAHAALRAALAAPPAEPGLGRLRRIEAAAFSLVSTFSVLPVPILTEHDHAALRALRAALSGPKP